MPLAEGRRKWRAAIERASTSASTADTAALSASWTGKETSHQGHAKGVCTMESTSSTWIGAGVAIDFAIPFEVEEFCIGESQSDATAQTEPLCEVDAQRIAGLIQCIARLELAVSGYCSDGEGTDEEDKYLDLLDSQLTAAQLEEIEYYDNIFQEELDYILNEGYDHYYQDPDSHGGIAYNMQAQSSTKFDGNEENSNSRKALGSSGAWLDQLD